VVDMARLIASRQVSYRDFFDPPSGRFTGFLSIACLFMIIINGLSLEQEPVYLSRTKPQ